MNGKKSMQMLFSVRVDGNLCAPSAIFRPQGRETKQTWGYFPSATNRKEDRADAIFHPPLTKKETMWRYFPSTMDVWRFWLMENDT